MTKEAVKFSEGDNPIVTVITATFNLVENKREAYFHQNVESVHDQTYPYIEHIVIDGASTDGTLELIEEYVRRGWISCISETDKGIYDAMNKGIRKAKGKYVVFLNSDDYYHGIRGIEQSIKALKESDSDFSYAPARIFDEERKKRWVVYPDTFGIFVSVPPFNHQTMLTKRDIFFREGFFDENFRIMGDLDFLLRIFLKRYKGVFVNDIFTTYRLSGLSSKNIDEGNEEAIQVLFKNYNPLFGISKADCGKIRKTRSLPFWIMFKVYTKLEISLFFFRRIISCTNRIVNFLFFRIRYIILGLKKCVQKYWIALLRSRLRRFARRVYYALKGKKV